MELLHGDCLEKMKDISSNSVDLIVADLPFGCLSPKEITVKRDGEFQKGGRGMSGCAWDIKIDLDLFWKEIKSIRRDDHTPVLHFCTTKFGYELIKSNEKEFRYDLVWDKGRGVSFLSANKMPLRSHEMVYVFSKAGSYYNRVDVSGEPYVAKQKKNTVNVYQDRKPVTTVNTGTRCVKSVVDIQNNRGNGKHPTEKPVELYKFLIERYCPSGGTVLDPTFGSGNSGLAARELGRKYIGIEKDEQFFKKAKEKLMRE